MANRMPLGRTFQETWDQHQKNRDFFKTFFSQAPNFNRCAMVLSKTLGVKPHALRNETSGADIDSTKKLPRQQQLNDYYASSGQLANRLTWFFGKPQILTSAKAARAEVAGKKGVIFFKNAYTGYSPRSILQFKTLFYMHHIDLWNGQKTGSEHAPFDHSGEIWFWETEEPPAIPADSKNGAVSTIGSGAVLGATLGINSGATPAKPNGPGGSDDATAAYL